MSDTRDSEAADLSRRKHASKLWSASSSIQWLDASGATLSRTSEALPMPVSSVKAKVYYRVGDVSKKPTFAGPDLATQAGAFQALLSEAYANDWVADDRGRPLPPLPLPEVRPSDTSHPDVRCVERDAMDVTEPSDHLTRQREQMRDAAAFAATLVGLPYSSAEHRAAQHGYRAER
jgi:hypothetical protein